MAEFDIDLYMEQNRQQSRDRVRQLLLDESRPDLAIELEQKYRDIDLGLDGARSIWNALSEPQRMVVRRMVKDGSHLWRDPHNPNRYYLRIELGAVIKVRFAMVRNLAARELVSWDGGAFEPEAKAVITERAHFVVKHGSVEHSGDPK